jgi:hypothetical protein
MASAPANITYGYVTPTQLRQLVVLLVNWRVNDQDRTGVSALFQDLGLVQSVLPYLDHPGDFHSVYFSCVGRTTEYIHCAPTADILLALVERAPRDDDENCWTVLMSEVRRDCVGCLLDRERRVRFLETRKKREK